MLCGHRDTFFNSSIIILSTGSYKGIIDRGWQREKDGSHESIFCGNWLLERPLTVNLRKSADRYYGFWYKMGLDGTSDLERSIEAVYERSSREGPFYIILPYLIVIAKKYKLLCCTTYFYVIYFHI